MNRRTLAFAWVIFALIVPLLVAAAPAAQAQSPVARVHPDGKRIVFPDGRARFVLGYNYEGPADRAWKMWQQFDLALIESDFARARGGGANTLRVFVQAPFEQEILADNFAKLDGVIAAAARHNLLLVLTLYDYDERALARVGEVNARIAARYRDNPTILAFDLRNEPQFLTIASATYPPGISVPLQRSDLIGVYGERVPRADIPAWRTGAGGRPLPTWWSDEQVYSYANNLAYFVEFLRDAEGWVGAAPGRTIVDYPADPAAQRWQPLWATLNDSLAIWINMLRDPMRNAGASQLITVGWSNLMFARLPANGDLLDVISLHRFPRPGISSVTQTLDLGAGLRRAFPNRPLLFEEIGYSTAEIDPEGAAILEMATTLRAYGEGYAGFLKWMLNDLPPVGNPREDNFGALRVDGSPKPAHTTFGAFGTYLGATAAEPSGTLSLWADGAGPGYSFAGPDLVYLAGSENNSVAGVQASLSGRGQLLLRKRGALAMLATQPAVVTLNLRTLMPAWSGGTASVEQRVGEGWAGVASELAGDELRFSLQPNTPYRVSLPRATDAVPARANCQFFPETGHNLCGAFLSYWQQRGGLAIFGLPLSEEFSEVSGQDGQTYTVQYFERNRFEYHPDQAGTPYVVLLGLLGNDLTAARRGEAAFVPLATPLPERSFFPETGHSLGGVFRDYWNAHGSLATFGFPISEEFQEYNPADGKIYSVQYFERNRFEYHPEQAGTPYVVLLGLLGNQTVDGRGWR